jgi:hypothetical protein
VSPPVLQSGNSERVKAAVHGVALASVAVCGAYNIAAWLVRRERHLAINALFYSAAIAVEIAHVRHHLAAPALIPVSDEWDDAA